MKTKHHTMKNKLACLFVLLSTLAMTCPLNAQTTVTLNGTSGSNTISDSYSTDGGLNLRLGLAVEYLIVGGGGSGVDGYGGGGGAGGFRTGSILLGNSTSAILVGAGGAAADRTEAGAGNNGTNSTAFAITALGGGAGGTYATGAPNSGGSGGGAGSINAQAGGAGSFGQGNNGGAGFRNTNVPATLTGGGGGGAGAAGQSGAISSGGAGGAGLSSDITGSMQWYAGGGGGSGFKSGGGPTGGAGGQGGGGAGVAGDTYNGTAGTANTGGGGGGAQSNDQGFNRGVGGAGGSGVVIARYQGTALGTGGTVTSGTGSATGFTLHSFTSIGNSTLTLTGLDTLLGATLTTSVTGSGGLTYNGPGTLTLAANSTYSGSTTITAGTLQVGDGGTTGSLGAGSVANNASLIFNRGNNHSVSNTITGAGSLTKNGSGVMTLSGNNTYSGASTVEAGQLIVDGSISSSATVRSGARIGGSGRVGGLILESGSTLTPGNSPGTLAVAGNAIWNAGANYNWQAYTTNTNAAVQTGAGTGWDLLDVSGTLTFSGLDSSNRFNLNLWSLSSTSPDTNGPIPGWDPNIGSTWLIASAAGGINLDGTTLASNTNYSSLFNINTGPTNGAGGWSGALPSGFQVLTLGDSNALYLQAVASSAAVPEPGQVAASLLLLAGIGGYVWLKRRKAAKAAAPAVA
jgi:autotransporter-associated beta strand protein